jgi:hypothetical protein
LQLPEQEREELLRRAERDRVSVRELRKQATALRRSSGERRGRPMASHRPLVLSDGCPGTEHVRKGLETLSQEVPLPDETRRTLRELARKLLELAGDEVERDGPDTVRSTEPPVTFVRSA